ncbi:hypothetical protein HB662_24040 [Roseomonas frigidaquae]|uniref:Uncharacterized protein n=1 Tax=Falsiroseomonas frigidaquae TaxID=487318 RepID=A0ABX1F6J4_9PROT|nr:hypothetical protein [Falsiroseomonas frigidaquae]NKE47869.1 hypothetical protein [Falsiroseomonas frigidaquae]
MSSAQIMPSPMASYAAPLGEAGLFYDPVLRMGISWLDKPARPEPVVDAGSPVSLAEAVAGIVAIAAARARNAGELLALRRAVEHALDAPIQAIPRPAPDPRESGLSDLPEICDARAENEADRLGALLRRQSPG